MTIWHWIAAAIVGLAAYCLASRKGRPEIAVLCGLLCLFAPIVFPVLFLLRRCGDGRVPGKWFVRPLLVFSSVIVVGRVALFVVTPGYGGQYELPSCASTEASDTAKTAVAGAPAGKLLGIAILDMSHMHETSSSSDERLCAATALLNSGVETGVKYRMFRQHDSDRWFLKIEMDQ